MGYTLPEIEMIHIELIEVGDNRRQLHQDTVERLAESMKKIGLRTPITVRHFEQHPDGSNSDCIQLVSGAHRLSAAQKLGWKEIPCFCLEEEPDEQAELWEISENLHRADLTVLERSTLTARWIDLTAIGFSQLGKNPKGGRPGAILAASKDLGIGKNAAYRAEEIAGLSDEAKVAAVETGLDDNQAVLLAAAKVQDDAAFLRAEHARREANKQHKDTDKPNKETRRNVVTTNTGIELGEYLRSHMPAQDIPMIISWLGDDSFNPKDVIGVLRRKAA